MRFDGLLSNGETSVPVRVMALDPTREEKVCPRRREMLLDGPLVTADDAIAGKDLAGKMSGPLTLVAINAHGRQNALDVRLVGRLDSPEPFANRRGLYVTLDKARTLLGTPGRSTEVGLALQPGAKLEEVRARVAAVVGSDLEVETWRERQPGAVRFVVTMEAVARSLSIVLLILVLGTVMNATRAAVDERRLEIGTMLAFGMRRRQIIRLFVAEASVLSLIAAVIGSAIGLLCCAWAARNGLELRAPGAKPFIVFPKSDLLDLVLANATILAGATLAAWLAARTAAKLTPTEALRET
jgi:putative ABC transport system permease protein